MAMTLNHLLYIPSIFLLGLFTGVAITSSLFSKKLGIEKPKYKVTGKLLASSLFIFMIVFFATHTLPLPGNLKSLHSSLGDKAIFDRHITFNADEVYTRLEGFGIEGRQDYSQFLFTSDLIFPLSFLFLFTTLSGFVSERVTLPGFIKKAIFVIPVLWFLFDLTENAIVFNLLSTYPERKLLLAQALGKVTTTKFFLLFLAIILPTFALIAYQKTNSRSKEHSK